MLCQFSLPLKLKHSTDHTFLPNKSKYGNKVLKTVVKHRTCSACKWWKRNRPGQKVLNHRSVWNHRGSSKLMEWTSGIQAIKEMMSQKTPVKVIEGDGDNTVISRIENEMGVRIQKKKLDRNYCVKNIVMHLYDLRNSKESKIRWFSTSQNAANISSQKIKVIQTACARTRKH